MNCDYAYTTPTHLVEGQTLTGLNVVITGTSLPTTATVTFAGVNCVVSAATGTQIDCALEVNPAAGDWTVVVKDEFGLIPVAGTVTAISVPLIVTSVTPNTNLNYLGGEVLTIVGQHFALDSTINTVTMADGTPCFILTSTDT